MSAPDPSEQKRAGIELKFPIADGAPYIPISRIPGKFDVAGLTPIASQTVSAPRALECPIQLEAVVAVRHGIMDDDPQVAGLISAFEVRITRVHVDPGLLMDGHANRIDPAKWQPLIMNLQKLYGVSRDEIVPSRLAEIEEKAYRMPDVDLARMAILAAAI